MGREQWLTASGRNPPSADDEHAAEAGLHQTARDKRADGGSILIWNKDGGVRSDSKVLEVMQYSKWTHIYR